MYITIYIVLKLFAFVHYRNDVWHGAVEVVRWRGALAVFYKWFNCYIFNWKPNWNRSEHRDSGSLSRPLKMNNFHHRSSLWTSSPTPDPLSYDHLLNLTPFIWFPPFAKLSNTSIALELSSVYMCILVYDSKRVYVCGCVCVCVLRELNG